MVREEEKKDFKIKMKRHMCETRTPIDDDHGDGDDDKYGILCAQLFNMEFQNGSVLQAENKMCTKRDEREKLNILTLNV